MKKKNVVAGILALALVFGMGLAGCASVDQQTLKKEGVPKDQRATLYLIYHDQRLEKIDGKKQGAFLTWYGILQGWPGTLKEEPKGIREQNIQDSAQVSAGEHTIVISNKAIIGRKSYEGTFNFEAGKKYLVQLVTPSLYESMMKPGFEGILADMGNHLKESLAGNYIVIIAESNKVVPTYYDNAIKSNQWVKSIK